MNRLSALYFAAGSSLRDTAPIWGDLGGFLSFRDLSGGPLAQGDIITSNGNGSYAQIIHRICTG